MKKRAISLLVIFIIGCAISLLMYRLFTDPEIRWQEEVKLHDGRVIVVDRWSKRQWGGEPGQRGMTLWWEIKAKNPNTGTGVVWNEDSGSSPVALDFLGNVAFVAASVDLYPACKKYGFPKMNWVFFKLDDGSWKRISYEEYPAPLDTNLLMSVWHAEDIGKLDRVMTLNKKVDYYKDDGHPDYSLRRSVMASMQGKGACARFPEAAQYQKP